LCPRRYCCGKEQREYDGYFVSLVHGIS
jgi:hypothetical protein